MSLRISGNIVVTQTRGFTLGTATPGTPATGTIRFNSSSSEFEVYDGASWVSLYIDNSPTQPLWGWGFDAAFDGIFEGNGLSPGSMLDDRGGWIQISAGDRFSLGISGGTVYGWGLNTTGQLGDGTTTTRSIPTIVASNLRSDALQVYAGTSHALGISGGVAYAWGTGANGRLGTGNTSNRSTPTLVVGGFTDWVQVSAGNQHSAGVRANGTLWCWGEASGGRLGNGSTTDRSSPVSVLLGFTDWVQSSAGSNYTLGLRANGTAWGWGTGTSGRIGDGTTTSRLSPVSVVGGFTDWIQLSASNSSASHSLGLRANGTAWGWGSNSDGKLGDGTITSRLSPVSVVGGFTDWVQLSAAYGRSFGIRANGTAWGWGANELGTGDTSKYSSPVSIIGGYTDWVQISGGSNQTIALRAI